MLARGILIKAQEGQTDITGTRHRDTIIGTDGNETITGTTGGDHLQGGAGDDTYVYNPGDGAVTITDTASIGEGNTLRFGAGIAVSDMVRSLRFVAPDNDNGMFIIRLGANGDEVRITGFDPQNPETGTHGIEYFEFADGSLLSFRELVRNTFVVQGDAADDSLSGTAVGDRLYGKRKGKRCRWN